MSVAHIEAITAFKIIANEPDSMIVDVRTFEEFNFVGFIDLSKVKDGKKKLLMLPWRLYPKMDYNPNFQMILEEFLNNNFAHPKEVKIIFICRSGSRSNQAAAYFLDLGYKNCYNIIGGFEGELNQENKRGNINGWKASNLDWGQK
jgi:rhodanese-related sulfurtransferase